MSEQQTDSRYVVVVDDDVAVLPVAAVPTVRTAFDPWPEQPGTAPDPVQDAVTAVRYARTSLRDNGDPLAAAVDSALSCAVALIALRGQQAGVDALRDVLGCARALVAEVTFAVQDRA